MHLHWKRAARCSVAFALVLGLGACGDDDDDAGGGTSGGGGEEASAEYCDALVAFNETVFQTDVADDASEEEATAAGETLQPLFDEVESNAPEDLADATTELGSTIDDLVAGDATAFNADETFETYLGLVSESVPQCGYDNTEVTAVDYAFENVPETLSSGTQAITLDNQSEAGEDHEFVVFRKADGETRSAEELLNDPAAAEEGPGEFVGVAFAPPGTSAASLITLEPGDYVAACFVSVGGGEEGAPHFTQGMFAEFSVE